MFNGNNYVRIVHNDRHGTLTDSVQPRGRYVVRFDGSDKTEDVPRSECRMEKEWETIEHVREGMERYRIAAPLGTPLTPVHTRQTAAKLDAENERANRELMKDFPQEFDDRLETGFRMIEESRDD